jgi:hypothetical protein
MRISPRGVTGALFLAGLRVGTIVAQPVSKADDQGAILAALAAVRVDSLCGARSAHPAPCGTVLVDTIVHFAPGQWGDVSEPFDSIIGSLPAAAFPIQGTHLRYSPSGEDWHKRTTLLKVGIAHDTVQSGQRSLVAIDITPAWGFPGWIASVSLSRDAGAWHVDRIRYMEE